METRGDPFDILISLHTPNLAKLDFQGNVSSHKYLLDMNFTNIPNTNIAQISDSLVIFN